MLRLKKQHNTISPAEMQDGDIGIIRVWPLPGHVGMVVKRNAKLLVSLTDNYSWFDVTQIRGPESQVEILPPGTEFVID